jgi:hypothetical protein
MKDLEVHSSHKESTTHELKLEKKQSKVSKQVGKINDSTFRAKNNRHQNAGKTGREISSVDPAFEQARERERGGEARKRRTPIQKDEQMRSPRPFPVNEEWESDRRNTCTAADTPLKKKTKER